MSTQFCPNCGANVAGLNFCQNCGTNVTGFTQNPQPTSHNETPPYSQSAPQGQYPQGIANPMMQPNASNFSNQYVIPDNYVETKTIWQRIIGTLTFNVDVVEEIERREDLTSEARVLFFTVMAILAALQIAIVFTTDLYTLYNPIGSIIEILGEYLGLNYIFVIVLANVGKSLGGYGTETSKEEMIRVLSFAYIGRAISMFLNLLSEYLSSLFFLWLIAFIYSAAVFLFVLKRALDKGYGTAIAVLIVAFIIDAILTVVWYFIVGVIFGDTYL